jgi:hypothetical protein
MTGRRPNPQLQPEKPPTIPARRPVPSPSAQTAIQKDMKEVFADQLADHSIPARRKLTSALLAQADKSSDAPVEQFVLLTAAIDSAVDAVSLQQAFRAADKVSEMFDVDGLGIKIDAVLRVGPKSAVPEQADENVSAVIELSSALANVDDYAAAARVCAALLPATAGNSELRTKLQQRQRELSAASEAAERYSRDLAKLNAKPDDPAANLAVGKYVCFVKGEWENGLPMLAKGDDPALRTPAVFELSKPITPEEIAHLADTWWDLAAKQSDSVAKANATAHAAALYESIIEKITGLRKVQIEKRIAEVAATHGSRPVELLKLMIGKSTAIDNSAVLLKNGDRISTAESFKTPIAFRIVAQTESNNIRISYAAETILFNWERNNDMICIDHGQFSSAEEMIAKWERDETAVNTEFFPAGRKFAIFAGAVPKKTWVTIELVVKVDSLKVSVNDEPRLTVNGDFSKIDQRLSIFPSSSHIMVKSVKMTKS